MLDTMTEWDAATLLRFSGHTCGRRPRVSLLRVLRSVTPAGAREIAAALVRETRPEGERERARFACLLRILARRQERAIHMPREAAPAGRRMRHQRARVVTAPTRAGPDGRVCPDSVRGRPPGQ